jgi:hypothetical protein
MRLTLAGCFLLYAVTAFAQSNTGTITGDIFDPAGAVVPNATIQAKNQATNAEFSAGSTSTGNYTMGSVPAGTYEVSVTAAGFKKYVRPNVVVPTAETVRVDGHLEVGAATESVTINEEAPLLKTESGEISHQIDYTAADELPIFTQNGTGGSTGLGNIRDPLSVVNLLPGASQQSDAVLRINGMPSSSQTIQVEGQDATNGQWRQNNQAVQQGVDAIQEVSIQTSNFAAEYGQAGGGYFNYTMKSGTNQYHGSAYDYFQNTILNAGLFNTNAGETNSLKAGQPVTPPVHRNDYGFTLGGPVRIPKVYNGKDKTFFFFNFEQFRQQLQNATTLATVPTTIGGGAGYTTGNFGPNSQTPFGAAFPFITVNPCAQPSTAAACADGVPTYGTGTIFDPTTTKTLAGGVIVRTPFPNQIIPMSRIDPAALYIQTLFPQANQPGVVNNYAIPSYLSNRVTTIPSIKIDQSLTSKMKLSGYFSVTRTTGNSADGLAETLAPVAPGNDTSYTTRVNYDYTITPTLLFHLGAGLLYFNHNVYTPTSNFTSQINAAPGVNGTFAPFPANNFMPEFAGLANGINLEGGLALGGFGGPSVGTPIFDEVDIKDVKPTFNSSLTWVRGNHTYKAGASAVFEGFPQQSSIRAFGYFGFGQAETGNPWENGLVGAFPTGFDYASFLLGLVDNEESSANNDTRLGNHAYGLFVQDNWKITHKLTLDYGVRWDYATLLTEQYGRMQSANWSAISPSVGLPGSINYGAENCGTQTLGKCQFNQQYPYAIGPRIGVAYQVTPKTVIRIGGGISYSVSPDNAYLSLSVANFYTLSPAGYGNPIATPLRGGQEPGLASVTNTYPQYTQFPFSVCPGANSTGNNCLPPSSPFISIEPGTGRLPRVFQWSIGVQREVLPNLLVEAAYVGNRGAWWEAPTLDALAYNALTPQQLLADGIDVHNPTQAAWLTTPLDALPAAALAAFPKMANPNNVYPGFPDSQTLFQALRPYPQWDGVPPFLGPPLGDTWYDSLQVKATKRYSHGLTAQVAYTWSKSLTNGANSNTAYLTPDAPHVTSVFDTAVNKQISGFNQPQVLVISFTYTTPKNKFGGDSGGAKALQWLSRDWTFGGVLKYASGFMIATPQSNSGLLNELYGPGNNPAIWGGETILENPVSGQSCLNINPNSHFDPTKTLALNPNAWVDTPNQNPGTFGVSAPYYANCRWQRQPSETLSVGRIFRIREKYQLQIRAEFQNVFNRVFYAAPVVENSGTAPTFGNNFSNGATGALNGGYGFVNSLNGAGDTPRSGQLVARFQF